MKDERGVAEAPAMPDRALPDADWTDAFEIAVNRPVNAIEAAHLALDRFPGWVSSLMALRNAIVAPLGLKGDTSSGAAERIGWFPVVEAGEDRVVLGFDDRHLDFRIVVTSRSESDGPRIVKAQTLVKRHNIGGKLYLAAVMPFHKLIVPALLKRLAA